MPSFDASSKTGPDISKEVILKLQLPRNNFNIKCAHKFLLFNKKRIRNIEFESPILSLRDEVAKQGKATGYQRCTHMPYPCSHFYFDIKFGDRLYSKEKRRAWPLLF